VHLKDRSGAVFMKIKETIGNKKLVRDKGQKNWKKCTTCCAEKLFVVGIKEWQMVMC